jgi:serine/threonine-protein kinase HipA
MKPAIGAATDAFSLEAVQAFQLADFAQRCWADRKLLKREATRLAQLAVEHAPTQVLARDYLDDAERAFASQLHDFVMAQANRLTQLAGDAARIKPEFL